MNPSDSICDTDELIASSYNAFAQFVEENSNFRTRQGQQEMAQCVAQTLAVADLSETGNSSKSIAIIQAGTGVGKSAAYASVAIMQGLMRNARLLISTATVALQEQLMQKDLPLLASQFTTPFKYTLAKGRGRYLCLMKCENRMYGESEDLFGDTSTKSLSDMEIKQQYRQKLARLMMDCYGSGKWNGERDSWSDPLDAQSWSQLSADYSTCTGRQCVHFKDCSYFKARQELVDSNVIVANHDLVLSSLGNKTLPDLETCLIVFDEAHHLPAVALNQFSSSMDLQSLSWLDKLPKALGSASLFASYVPAMDVAEGCNQLKQAIQDLARLSIDMVLKHTKNQDGVLRFPKGVLPESIQEIVSLISKQSDVLAKILADVVTEIKRIHREDPNQVQSCVQEVALLGNFQPRLSTIQETSKLLLENGEQPLAKWISVEDSETFLQLTINACPIVSSDLLNQFLWNRVRAAILTSASLTTCGSFDFFLRESGLSNKNYVQTLKVSSPFNYAEQGVLEVVKTNSEPKDVRAYTQEIIWHLQHDLQEVRQGALVLFTSKAQMQTVVRALPENIMNRVLVQGDMSRKHLLEMHQERIKQGGASILFGLQSFGEGLDLPGALCETLIITKLPFGSPADPIDEARSEWYKELGRDTFMDWVVPETGMKLLQWTGRAIRTEADNARIICYDKRLIQQGFGKMMLAGLPNYARIDRS